MRMLATILVAVQCVAGGTGFAQSIGVTFQPDDWDCDAVISASTQATWYLCASVGGAARSGIIGAEFRQDGSPAGWPMTAIPNPAASYVRGDPLAGGCQIAFPDCQSGGSPGIVLLYTIQGLATTSVGCTRLTILQHTTPSNPLFRCPVLVLCDAPVYTKICVMGAEGLVNGACSMTPPDPCRVALTPVLWSQVKRLYD